MEYETAVTMREARREAVETARRQLGTYPRVGDGEYDHEEGRYSFAVTIRTPKLILSEDRDSAVDLRYLQPVEVGAVHVDAGDRSVDCPTRGELRGAVREYEAQLNEAIQKAVVRATGSNLSHLPFPGNQYAPVQDIISEVILNGEIDPDRLERMDDIDDSDKYRKYVDDLVEVDLLNRRSGTLVSGDVLTTIQKRQTFRGHSLETHHDELDAALGRYFESNVGEIDMIKRTLGPYLAVAGYYYRRALELDELPRIEESDLRRGIELEYTGQEREQKVFKLSRYLVQLESVGVLESIYQSGDRYWVGDGTAFDNLRQSAGELGPVTNIIDPAVTEQQTLGRSD